MFFLLSFLFLLAPFISLAQPQENIELYFETMSSEDENSESFLEKIEYFSNNPVNLFYATTNQISEMPGISYLDAYLIHELFRNADTTITIDSIARYLQLTSYQIYILKSCSIIKKEKETKFTAMARERSSYQFETADGYLKNKYLGASWNLYQKYQVSSSSNNSNYNFGAIINKNSGEQHLAEFYSGYLQFQTNSIKLILGDFSIKAGLGNIFGETYSINKGINTINPAINYNNKLSPYTSKIDYNLLRGIASRLDFKIAPHLNLSSTVWYSNVPRSGNSPGDTTITSLYTSGTYRTETEIKKKNAVDEQLLGASVEINGCSYSTGILVSYINYNKFIKSSSSRSFMGKSGFVSSIYSTYSANGVTLTGELSLDNNSNIGLKIGSAYRSKNFDFAIHVRSFEENYRAPFGSIFGEFSYPANELGFYTGFAWKKNETLNINTYFDWFRSYTSTYSIDTNVTGFEIFTQFDVIFNKNTTCYARLLFKNKTAQYKDKKISNFYQREKIGTRIELSHDFSKNFNIRNRIELSLIDNKNIISNEFGAAAFVECSWRLTSFLRVQARATYFNTDSYTSAIWQYEYYYPGYSYAPALYDEGTRSYLSAQFKISKYCNLYLRYVNLYKFSAEYIGSSYEKINSNQQNRIYTQLDFKF